MKTILLLSMLHYNTVKVAGVNIFYREAGPKDAPTILLMHGYPSSSFMFRNPIPILSEKYHVIAPDLPGFGFSDAPAREDYRYTFDNLANTMQAFIDTLGLKRFAMYIFDYGAPVGLRLAMANSEKITGIISQNGNAYEAGLLDWSDGLVKAYWEHDTKENRDALRKYFTLEGFKHDDPNTVVKFYDTGHFALETHCKEIGQDILAFLPGLPK